MIDHDRLMDRAFPDISCSYGWRESALYALGLGIGSDPLAADELRFVYEKDIQALPSMAVVLGHPGFWISDPAVGIDFRQVVHGEQSLVVHAPLAPQAELIARNSIDEIIDKGPGRGAIMRVRRDLHDAATGALQSTQVMSMFCRGDGGFGGPATGRPLPTVNIPERAPDRSVIRPTLAQAALIYRLSGDYNPLHADPEVARNAGFARPIFHGLGTYGVACYALIAACAGGQAAALKALDCRFTSPVFPGETLRTDMWDEDGVVLFRCTALGRDAVVLDRGRAEFIQP
ncbi:MaoC/PaaZ C-terminal domain-containing protein [Novosphingobium cyanobacteriorum]|uniref:MaoC/PaaZ C-terminal domain-containing protein n=1 Tax=Novosphingobium cyanobacteriorum TaxID=3024215 RepID=A0ABT6CND2_9SPHN|nr:MaoC/PaaZ C-terminal domain-containing protein [Novosphingobium cyanobacteriorum]MDF8334590.1 MaoC/PaaZ C-terminal domain-containing protein [Novosphingobium cyanobacteriorum]